MAAKRRRKTKIHWNIGMIIFVVILVYILINVILFLGKKKLTVYKVTELCRRTKTDQEIRNGLYG